MRGVRVSCPMSWFIRGCGLLIALRSLTNFAKLFQGDDAVLVVFGQILRGGDAALPAALIGLFMLVTGTLMLIGSRWAGLPAPDGLNHVPIWRRLLPRAVA